MRAATFCAVVCILSTIARQGAALVDIPAVLNLPIGDTDCGALGKFSNGPPWTTPLRPVPAPNCNFNVTFWLCRSGQDPVRLQTWPTINLTGTTFDPSKKTAFVTHGFADNVLKWWPQWMAEAIHNKTQYNVIAVDWSPGAKGPNYLQAMSNTRITAAHMGRVMQHLIDNYKMSRIDIILIGHSLGAQISGYASNCVKGVGHVMGMDSASPGFEEYSDKILSLESSDACFVDGIHTNAEQFGYLRPFGDVDFYVNGGSLQPGCLEEAIDLTNYTTLNSSAVVKAVVACSHCRAYDLILDAIRYPNLRMWGHLISPSQNGTSSESCEEGSCVPMGLEADKFNARGSFAVMTKGESTYCIPDPDADAAMASKSYDETEMLKKWCESKNIVI